MWTGQADQDGDGNIDWDEFWTVIKSIAAEEAALLKQ